MKICGKNEIVRKSYITKKGTKVKENCIPNPGYGEGKRSDWVRKLKSKMSRRRKLLKKKYPDQQSIPICKKGYILREAYGRKYTSQTLKKGFRKGSKTIKPKKKNLTFVKAACIKDRGLPGKWSDTHSEVGIGPLKKGTLGQYGYSKVLELSLKKRQNSLKKAIKNMNALVVWRKLNAIYVYNKNTNPKLSQKFKKDRDWIKNNWSLKRN